MRADEFHHVHASHLGDERVVRGTRREIRADRAGQNGCSSGGRLNARAQHQRNQRGAHGGGAARGRRNGDVHEERDHCRDRDQEKAQAANRSGQVVHERAVALRVSSRKGKAHRTADCHDERIVRHRLGKLVQTHHRVKTDDAQEKTGGNQHQSRFPTLDQCPNGHEDHCNGNPGQ